MAEEAKYPDTSILTTELDDALSSLDAALVEAGRSVAVIRTSIAQFAGLTDMIREMEAAMNRARDQLTVPLNVSQQAGSAPPLHAVPAPEPAKEAAPASVIAAPIVEDEPAKSVNASPSDEEAAPAAAPSTSEESSAAPRCLRLSVNSKTGSLDLKAVDGSVNENPSVVDVALLDYDGRRATLKLWINESDDPVSVREALLASLRKHLGGDEGDAEMDIEFEEGSAA